MREASLVNAISHVVCVVQAPFFETRHFIDATNVLEQNKLSIQIVCN